MEDILEIITPHTKALRGVRAQHEAQTGKIVQQHIDDIAAGDTSDIGPTIERTTAALYDAFAGTARTVEAQIDYGAYSIGEVAQNNTHLQRLLQVVEAARSEGASPDAILRRLPRDTQQRQLAAIAVGIYLDADAFSAARSLAARSATREAVQRMIGGQVSVRGVVDTAIHAALDATRLQHVLSADNLRDAHDRIGAQASSKITEAALLAALDGQVLSVASKKVRDDVPASEVIAHIVTPLATPAAKPRLQAAVIGEEARWLAEQEAIIQALYRTIRQHVAVLVEAPLPTPTAIDLDSYTIALRDSGMLDASGVVNFMQASVPTGQSQIFRTPNGERYSAPEYAEVLHTSQGLLVRIGGVIEGMLGYPAVPTGTAHYIYPDSGITYSTPASTRATEIGHTRIPAEPASVAQLELVIAYLKHLGSLPR